MSQTIDAVIDTQGHIRLLEKIKLDKKRRAKVIILDDDEVYQSDYSIVGSMEILDDDLEGHCKSYTGVLDACVHTGNCGIRPVIVGLHDVVQRALSGITLAQLIGTEANVETTLHWIQGLSRPPQAGTARKKA